MALNWRRYSRGRWSSIQDAAARAAAQEQAQAIEQLARDVAAELADAVLPGEIRMFETECPAGWSLVSELVDKFPRGASTGGSTGGADTHYHDVVNGHVATDYPSLTQTVFVGTGSGGSYEVAHKDHTHGVGGYTEGESNVPAYYTVVFCKKD